MIYFKLLLGIATLAIILFNIIKGFTPSKSPNKETVKDIKVVLLQNTYHQVTS